jgi:hypothetical protein
MGMLAIIRCRILSSSLLSKNIKIKIYRTIILPTVSYECNTWSLTLREEQRLRVFENSVLRRIFGPKNDEVTVEWRRLHNQQLYYLYSSSNCIRVIILRRKKWARCVAGMENRKGAYSVLVGRSQRKRPRSRRRRRWENNIKMDLQDV